jgi:hypothetical protein
VVCSVFAFNSKRNTVGFGRGRFASDLGLDRRPKTVEGLVQRVFESPDSTII